MRHLHWDKFSQWSKDDRKLRQGTMGVVCAEPLPDGPVGDVSTVEGE